MLFKKPLLPIIVVLLCFVFGLFFLISTPATTPPDEIAHLSYPRYLIYEHELPSFTSSSDFWESHQPPLYYLLSVPFVKAFSSFPIQQQLYLDRVTSLILYALSLFVMYKLVKKIFISNIVVQSFVLLLLGIPMVAYLSGAFSNDILVFLISTLCCFWIFYKSKLQLRHTDALLLGCILACGLLTKINLYPLLALTFVFVLWKKPLIYWLGTSLFAAAIASWWFIHNIKTAGDLFGLSKTFILWESQKADFISVDGVLTLCGKLFSGFWGVFGKYTIWYPVVVYIILGIVSVVFIVILLKNVRTPESKKICITIFFITGFVILQNFSFYQPQGRYLVSLVPVLAVGLGYVIESLRQDKIKIYLFSGFLLLVFFLNTFGLYLQARYYRVHPVTSFAYPRVIDVLEKGFVANSNFQRNENNAITIFLPATLSTLQDFRINTEKRITIYIRMSSNDPVFVKLQWKVLGETTFHSARFIEQEIFGTSQIVVEEKEKTLIQEIQVEFGGDRDSINLDEFTITIN